MREQAEPREFGLSEFQTSRYLLLSVASPLAAVAACVLLIAAVLGRRPSLEEPLALAAGLSGAAAAVLSRVLWLKARRPFARASRHGLSLDLGLLAPAFIPWREIYAIESIDPFTAVLKLSRLRSQRIALAMLEREDRPQFVNVVRQWIYSSH